MENAFFLVEGITDRSFIERLPGLERERIEWPKTIVGGQEWAKGEFARRIGLGTTRIVLCLDIDDQSPEDKFSGIVRYLQEKGISVTRTAPDKGHIGAGNVTALFVPFGLWDDQELRSLHIARHSFEDYLIKIALGDPGLRPPGSIPLGECLGQVVSEYDRKGCQSLASAQVYQFMKPFVGLPKHETGAISQLLGNANPQIVKQVTASLVERLSSFLREVGPDD